MKQQKQSTKELNIQSKSCSQKYKFKSFYYHEMVKIVRPLAMNKILSITLLVICQLTILSFVYKNENYYVGFTEKMYKNQNQRLYQISNFIQYLQVLPFVQDYLKPQNTYLTYFVILSFTLNCFYISKIQEILTKVWLNLLNNLQQMAILFLSELIPQLDLPRQLKYLFQRYNCFIFECNFNNNYRFYELSSQAGQLFRIDFTDFKNNFDLGKLTLQSQDIGYIFFALLLFRDYQFDFQPPIFIK
ncbi:transmembrane protein, putative (macronuclear) [Tetrahymena thermophila SB210]|uniref:Transmembrane protein, putative n=1 Tax=Tetrahymena thermophila (strain SB210) TaxID=312017 RepID=Q22VC6_TETTS|nr:transmembrane protein, putative [Tetrahymena thermophila SB210]EAR89239.1 transmembrane protein, putative [Tetrahymena thermophila SB210]|eukprot:XP_001009484.1 transmembrane protein, putative [Tetrahymena thermophila SB210]